ncbi:MAG: hypothetical protein AB7O57_00250 [Hyphomicrobiaceae bacterium]
MPKFGTHLIIAELAAQKRPDVFGVPHSNAFRLGAIGPDTTLFMFDPATSNPDLRKGFETALSVLEIMQDVKDEFKKIEETLTRPVDDLKDYLTGGLSKDLSYTVEAGIEALLLAAKLGIAFGVGSINVNNPLFSRLPELPGDFIKNPEHAAQKWVVSTTDNFGFPFRMFGHPLTDDGAWKSPEPTGDYSKWWWMDMLHYRKTGQFASQLLRNANGHLEESYAKGYMTHVAGDITGHPFINSLVGGPFRNHAYRHLVLETLADTWLWHEQARGDAAGAGLNRQIDLGTSEARRIAELVVKSMRDVYKPPMVPALLRNGYPDRDEFLGGYRLLKQYLRLSTGGTIRRPQPPPDRFDEVWKEIRDLLDAANPGPPPNWNGNIADFIASLFSWAAKGFVLIAMIVLLPAAVLTRLVALAPRWVIYLLNLSIFYIISAIRTMLCLTGWGYASIDDFKSFGFLEDMITSRYHPDVQYPRKTGRNPKPPFYWLESPDRISQVERGQTVAFVPARQGFKPNWMISSSNAMDLAHRVDLERLAQAPTPSDALQLQLRLRGSNGFGNAVDFSIALLEGSFPVPDLDLDGDRGYGYRGWEELPPNERYV